MFNCFNLNKIKKFYRTQTVNLKFLKTQPKKKKKTEKLRTEKHNSKYCLTYST